MHQWQRVKKGGAVDKTEERIKNKIHSMPNTGQSLLDSVLFTQNTALICE